ncbi:MAG: IclR family transcriptional regulator, partial [Microbacterium sp.]
DTPLPSPEPGEPAAPLDEPLSDPRLTAAQRVLAVLEVFDQDHLLLSLTDISRRAGLTLSTTHRLVRELRDWGALERKADGRYAIGMRILELGSLEPQGLQLREVALPYLGDLHTAVGTDVNLAVRDGHDVVYVESIRSLGGAPVLTRLGGRWPLHATATGQVLLAHAPDAFRDQILAEPLTRYTPRTVTDPDRLRAALAEVRRSGHAIVDESITQGAIALAAPVRGQRDRLVAAVGVTIRRGSVDPQSVLPALTMTARAISRALGAPVHPRRPAGVRP